MEECPGMSNPTIGIEINKTYTFSQGNISSYYHPMGFAYYADGAHDDKPELEPGVAPYGTNSSCAKTLTCPAPMYFKNGTYLGTYSNNPEIAKITKGKDDFGLDQYEPRFYYSVPEWVGFGTFEVKLRFDNEDFIGDLFYFCHVRTPLHLYSCYNHLFPFHYYRLNDIYISFFFLDSSIHVWTYQVTQGRCTNPRDPPP